jgi:hypothetical protein
MLAVSSGQAAVRGCHGQRGDGGELVVSEMVQPGRQRFISAVPYV